MATATIQLTIVSFEEINTTTAAPRWCQLKDRNITFGAERVFPSSTNPMAIVVKAPVDLEFTILPAGLLAAGAFYVQKVGAADPHGKKNFKFKDVTGNKLTISNKHIDKGPHGSAPRWELYIVLQDTNGKIGIIDPGIENEN